MVVPIIVFPDGVYAIRASASDEYKRIYDDLASLSACSTYTDFPWDRFVFDDPSDNAKFAQRWEQNFYFCSDEN